MTDAPDFLRAGEIARLTGVSVRTVRRWIADEIVPSVKVRGARLVPRKALECVLSPPTADLDDLVEESKGITDD
jgi:excisionase family DNA binding protein